MSEAQRARRKAAGHLQISVGAADELGAERQRQSAPAWKQTLEDDPEAQEAQREANKRLQASLATKPPREVFAYFDRDGSGTIDFTEFREMLPVFGIELPEAKALKYFALCDVDGSGTISFDEFQVALYACDPSGNAQGFRPSQLLHPRDAFEMFDTDGSGEIDEDEFYFVLQYLGVRIGEARLEKTFRAYDKDRSGYIDYSEFLSIWLKVVDVRHELSKRGIKYSRWSLRTTLEDRLAEALRREDEEEERGMLEAARWRRWREQSRAERETVLAFFHRVVAEMAHALDAAGQVHVFGEGPTCCIDLPTREWPLHLLHPCRAQSPEGGGGSSTGGGMGHALAHASATADALAAGLGAAPPSEAPGHAPAASGHPDRAARALLEEVEALNFLRWQLYLARTGVEPDLVTGRRGMPHHVRASSTVGAGADPRLTALAAKREARGGVDRNSPTVPRVRPAAPPPPGTPRLRGPRPSVPGPASKRGAAGQQVPSTTLEPPPWSLAALRQLPPGDTRAIRIERLRARLAAQLPPGTSVDDRNAMWLAFATKHRSPPRMPLQLAIPTPRAPESARAPHGHARSPPPGARSARSEGLASGRSSPVLRPDSATLPGPRSWSLVQSAELPTVGASSEALAPARGVRGFVWRRSDALGAASTTMRGHHDFYRHTQRPRRRTRQQLDALLHRLRPKQGRSPYRPGARPRGRVSAGDANRWPVERLDSRLRASTGRSWGPVEAGEAQWAVASRSARPPSPDMGDSADTSSTTLSATSGSLDAATHTQRSTGTHSVMERLGLRRGMRGRRVSEGHGAEGRGARAKAGAGAARDPFAPSWPVDEEEEAIKRGGVKGALAKLRRSWSGVDGAGGEPPLAARGPDADPVVPYRAMQDAASLNVERKMYARERREEGGGRGGGSTAAAAGPGTPVVRISAVKRSRSRSPDHAASDLELRSGAASGDGERTLDSSSSLGLERGMPARSVRPGSSLRSRRGARPTTLTSTPQRAPGGGTDVGADGTVQPWQSPSSTVPAVLHGEGMTLDSDEETVPGTSPVHAAPSPVGHGHRERAVGRGAGRVVTEEEAAVAWRGEGGVVTLGDVDRMLALHPDGHAAEDREAAGAMPQSPGAEGDAEGGPSASAAVTGVGVGEETPPGDVHEDGGFSRHSGRSTAHGSAGVSAEEWQLRRHKARLAALQRALRTEQAAAVGGSGFAGLSCAPVGAALWGRGVVDISLGQHVGFAVTGRGEVLAWGGRLRDALADEPSPTRAHHARMSQQLAWGAVGVGARVMREPPPSPQGPRASGSEEWEAVCSPTRRDSGSRPRGPPRHLSSITFGASSPQGQDSGEQNSGFRPGSGGRESSGSAGGDSEGEGKAGVDVYSGHAAAPARSVLSPRSDALLGAAAPDGIERAAALLEKSGTACRVGDVARDAVLEDAAEAKGESGGSATAPARAGAGLGRDDAVSAADLAELVRVHAGVEVSEREARSLRMRLLGRARQAWRKARKGDGAGAAASAGDGADAQTAPEHVTQAVVAADWDLVEDYAATRLERVAAYFDVWAPAEGGSGGGDRLAHFRRCVEEAVPLTRLRQSLLVHGERPGAAAALDQRAAMGRLAQMLWREGGALSPAAARRLQALDVALANAETKDGERLWEEARDLLRQAGIAGRGDAVEEEEGAEWGRGAADEASRGRMVAVRRGQARVAVEDGVEAGLVSVHAAGRAEPLLAGRAEAPAPSVVFHRAVRQVAAGPYHAVAVDRSGRALAWGMGSLGRLGLDDQSAAAGETGNRGSLEAVQVPTPVERWADAARVGRRGAAASVAAGYGHTVCVDAEGRLFAWGAASSGKLGLEARPAGRRYLDVCPTPQRVPLPRGSSGAHARVRHVACGWEHTAAVSEEGALFTWGAASGGRLGVEGATGSVPQPHRVTLEGGARALAVACGRLHTVVLCARDPSRAGGDACDVRVAGAAPAVEPASDTFRAAGGALGGLGARQVACGAAHSAVVTGCGQVVTWGDNAGGRAAQPLAHLVVRSPTVCPAFARPRRNLARAGAATQSSTFCGASAARAMNGDRSGEGLARCAHTQRDLCPWWEVDLGAPRRVELVRVFLRRDVPTSREQSADAYVRRSDGVRMMLSLAPFAGRARRDGEASLASAMAQCFAWRRVERAEGRLEWRLGPHCVARTLRLQLPGREYLSVAEVEVWGWPHAGAPAPTPALRVACTERSTAVATRPLLRGDDLGGALARAVHAAGGLAGALRHLPPYADCPALGEEGALPRVLAAALRGHGPDEGSSAPGGDPGDAGAGPSGMLAHCVGRGAEGATVRTCPLCVPSATGSRLCGVCMFREMFPLRGLWAARDRGYIGGAGPAPVQVPSAAAVVDMLLKQVAAPPVAAEEHATP